MCTSWSWIYLSIIHSWSSSTSSSSHSAKPSFSVCEYLFDRVSLKPTWGRNFRVSFRLPWRFLYFSPAILALIPRFAGWKVIINGWTVMVSHTLSQPVPDKHTYSFSTMTRIYSPLASSHKKKGDILQPCDTEYPSFVYEPSVKETNSIIKCGRCQK